LGERTIKKGKTKNAEEQNNHGNGHNKKRNPELAC
jgi:hypothetical protein